ncbi:phospholipid methyltransferase-domain-containing protein [Glomus cerebriforme]|uniref:Phosphatidyl-N-methylethanolamine N-methyltransferase n=1 Tax=Glomus cerebriforme TaxID=658196 RepID=A0A397TWN0_9GLOM|nr:phospholipid methyltransferase-domain-containing protein [Glomus cerebriforme]
MYQEFLDRIDFSQNSFWISFASITFNPFFWNIVARKEHKTRFLTRLVGGNPYVGCYCLAVVIFFLGIFRDILYKKAIEKQPILPSLDNDYSKGLALVLFFAGNCFVLSSMYVLGVTGTYLGDYFGILMDERVTSFPFNVLDNPMYYGSSMVFLSTALWYASPAGIILTIWAFILYSIALQFEGPFTSMIYAQRDEKIKRQKNE